MSFEKLPAIESGVGGCACCGYQYQHLPLQKLIAVGFGVNQSSPRKCLINRLNPSCASVGGGNIP